MVGLRLDQREQIAAHRRPRRLHRERRSRRNLLRQRQCLGAQAVGGHQQIDETPVRRLLRLDATRGEIHQQRALTPDHPLQHRRNAETRVKSQRDEIGDEARLRRRDAEIGDEREAEACSHRRALDCGDDGRLHRVEARGGDVEGVARARGLVLFDRIVAGKVGTGAEDAAIRLQHDRAYLRVGIRRGKGGADRLDQRKIGEIVRRAREGEDRDMAVAGGVDEGLGHGATVARIGFARQWGGSPDVARDVLHAPISSLRAERSNPGVLVRLWIAALRSQ